MTRGLYGGDVEDRSSGTLPLLSRGSTYRVSLTEPADPTLPDSPGLTLTADLTDPAGVPLAGHQVVDEVSQVWFRPPDGFDGRLWISVNRGTWVPLDPVPERLTERLSAVDQLATGDAALAADDFTVKAAGPLGTALTGQAWSNVGGAELVVQVDGDDVGGMTLPGTGIANGYATVHTDDVPVFWCGTAQFDSTVGSGEPTVTILCTPGDSFNSGFNLGLHLVIRRSNAVAQIRENAGSFIDLASWSGMAIGDEPFTVAVWRDGSTMHILGPDGTWRTIQDSRIPALCGRVTAFQCVRDGAGQQTGRWLRVAATSTPPAQRLPYVTGPMVGAMLARLIDDSGNLIARKGTTNQVRVGQTALGVPGLTLGPAADGNHIVALPGVPGTIVTPATVYVGHSVDTAVQRVSAGLLRVQGALDVTVGLTAGGSRMSAGPVMTKPGRWHATGQVTATSGALGIGVFRAMPHEFDRDVVLTDIAVDVTANGETGSVFRVAVYADDGGVPGALVADLGTLPADSSVGTPMRTLTLAQVLPLSRGRYWFGGAVQNVVTTQPTLRIASAGVFSVPYITSAPTTLANAPAGLSASGVTGAAPSALGTLAQSALIPRVAFKVAA